MALFKSQIATQVSGSIGGTTFARNAGGMYMRARSIPVDPNSSAQLAVRNALVTLVAAWTETLTALQRASWELYASNVPVLNPLGDPITNSGQNWFIAANTPRIQASATLPTTTLPIVLTAPTIFDRGLLTTPLSPQLDISTATAYSLDGVLENTNPWAATTGGALLIYQGRPANGSRTFFRGPFRLVARILGNSVTPPTESFAVVWNPATLGFVTAVTSGQWFRFVATTADGRLSTGQIVGPVTVSA